jgi:hypothetical protein
MTAVRLPSRLAGCKVLVGVSNAPVVLFAELVLRRIRIRVAPQPEILDEGVALLIVAQVLERLRLFVRDDVGTSCSSQVL